MINNFLSNSFKFTDSGSVTLGVILDTQGGTVEVYVEDTGIGMSEEKMSGLFTRYNKMEEDRKGTGLGLSICKEIILNHQGDIRVLSELGKGSRFSFVLPIAQ